MFCYGSFVVDLTIHEEPIVTPEPRIRKSPAEDKLNVPGLSIFVKEPINDINQDCLDVHEPSIQYLDQSSVLMEIENFADNRRTSAQMKGNGRLSLPLGMFSEKTTCGKNREAQRLELTTDIIGIIACSCRQLENIDFAFSPHSIYQTSINELTMQRKNLKSIRLHNYCGPNNSLVSSGHALIQRETPSKKSRRSSLGMLEMLFDSPKSAIKKRRASTVRLERDFDDEIAQFVRYDDESASTVPYLPSDSHVEYVSNDQRTATIDAADFAEQLSVATPLKMRLIALNLRTPRVSRRDTGAVIKSSRPENATIPIFETPLYRHSDARY